MDATVTVVNHTGVDPLVAAAEHARQQADVYAHDLQQQEARAVRELANIAQRLETARQAAADAEDRAIRAESLVRTES